jgi:predicted ATPase
MITALVVQNFKCFKDVRIPLNPLTVISGGNGVGKSTIIQSLLLLRQTSDKLRFLEDFTGASTAGNVEFPVRLNDAYHLALGNSSTVTNSEIESEAIWLGVSASPSTSWDPMIAEFHADTAASAVTITCRHQAANSSVMLEREPGLSLFAREFHYLVAERVGPRDLYNVSDSEYPTTGFCGEFTAHAITICETAVVQPSLCLVDGSDLFKVQLEGWMSQLVPGIRVVTHPYPEINRVRISIERQGRSTQPMSPMNTGFGISYVLPILVSGLLAKPGTMLIVENPEAHLHPSAQSLIGQFLACVAAAGVHVIVETHSDNVLNGVRLAAIEGLVDHADVGFLFLSLSGGETQPDVKPISVDKASELSSWPSGFFDQQGRDLTALMRARMSARENLAE